MSLATVTLQDGLNTIGENAFFCCTLLKTLNMPASVKSIGNRAFYECQSLAKITYNGTVQDWESVYVDQTAFADVGHAITVK